MGSGRDTAVAPLDPSHTAFVAVDLQRAFCASDGSVAKQGRDVEACQEAARNCAGLATAVRQSGCRVVWTRMGFRADYADGGLLVHVLRPGIKRIGGLRWGTSDVDFVEEVAVAEGDLVIDKPRYSSFYATGLDATLRAMDIRTLLVGGVTTSMCVESTVRDAGQRDYDTWVLRDACADFDAGRHAAALEAMAFGFARIIDGRSALAALGSTERAQ